MAARGAELKDIISAIEEATPQIDSFYAPATNEYLRRDGRISLYEMKVGPLRGMLPLIRVWGRIAVIGKARTQAENIAKMLELARKTNSPEARRSSSSRTPTIPRARRSSPPTRRRRLKCAKLIVTPLGPSAGAYCGEGTVGLGFCPSLQKLN